MDTGLKRYAKSHLLISSTAVFLTVLLIFFLFQFTLPKVTLFCNETPAQKINSNSETSVTSDESLNGLTGVKGDQGLPGATGEKGSTGAKGEKGATGLTGEKGPTGATGAAGVCTYVEALITNIFPSRDNTYNLGSPNFRWKELYLGPNSISMIDEGNGNDVKINVQNGILALNGADTLRFGNIKFTSTGISSDDPNIDITIGSGLSTGYLKVPTGIKFADGTVMTTLPIGTVGPTGPTGLTGAKGDTGLTGPKGDTGATGPGGFSSSSSSYTPVFTGSGFSGTTSITGSYNQSGKIVFFKIALSFTNVSNNGTGPYYLTLPFAPDGNYIFRDGGLHSGVSNHYQVMLDANSSSTTAKFMYPANGGQDSDIDANHPKAFATNDYLYISGIYQIP